LRVLTTVTGLTQPEAAIDSAVLADLAPGSRVFWQVEALLPGGERTTSETFVTRVQ
jgi:hypothetical protein